MNFSSILEQSGISILLFVICVYYAWRLLFMKDYASVRGKDQDPPKDIEGYCKAAGLIVIFFAVSTLVMAGLVLIDPIIGFVQILICTVIMVILWKKMSDKYV